MFERVSARAMELLNNASLSTTLMVVLDRPKVALVTLLRPTLKASMASLSLSFNSGTVNEPESLQASMVSVPLVEVKSVPAVAVPAYAVNNDNL